MAFGENAVFCEKYGIFAAFFPMCGWIVRQLHDTRHTVTAVTGYLPRREISMRSSFSSR
jgi:hypothetical protein